MITKSILNNFINSFKFPSNSHYNASFLDATNDRAYRPNLI